MLGAGAGCRYRRRHMDASEWMGLQATHNPHRWVLPVTAGVSAPGGFLFGGCALGAAIAAMERVTGRPVVWAAAQYLSYAPVGSTLDIDVVVAVEGRHVTQARALGHVVDREIFTVNAALGTRPYEGGGEWTVAPAVPPPDRCRRRRMRFNGTGSVGERMDVRLANALDHADLEGHPRPDGRSALWARVPDIEELTGAELAMLGDYVPFGIGQALGRAGGGNSLDNTLRVYRRVPDQWVLLDVRIQAVADGFGHGVVHLWGEDGTLLATASQSTIVRSWPPPDPEPPAPPASPAPDRGGED